MSQIKLNDNYLKTLIETHCPKDNFDTEMEAIIEELKRRTAAEKSSK